MDFIDEVTIHVASGKGGDGAVTFRREKHVPHGGPNGGDGGAGGDVTLLADQSLNTLVELRYSSRYKAADGGRGATNNKSGVSQSPLIIRVPVGVSAFDLDEQRVIADLVFDGQTEVVARGGRGGRGNASFASSTNQAPKYAEKGEPGEERSLRLELRLLADVGVVGFPSSGKSTLIAAVSNARPKIADYPFTTLVPNLGVVRVSAEESFVMADVPGLIEGAHEGAGLGHRFLRHIERTRVLIHLIDCSPLTGRDPLEDYGVIRRELLRYSSDLGERPEIIALNKIDIPEARQRAQECSKELPLRYPEIAERGELIRLVSTVTGEGVQQLVWDAAELVRQTPKVAGAQSDEVVRIEGPQAPFTIDREATGEFVVKGREALRIVAMTDLDNEQALRRLQQRLDRLGVFKQLRRLGIRNDDTVRIGDFEFDWLDENAAGEQVAPASQSE
ncbi:MAG: GTPase ObgE [Armatimonadetes bacterium]|nr:GTPase ObgE [Armatimonadota bacterium]